MLPIQSAKERGAKGRKAASGEVHAAAEGHSYVRAHERPKPKLMGADPKRASKPSARDMPGSKG